MQCSQCTVEQFRTIINNGRFINAQANPPTRTNGIIIVRERRTTVRKKLFSILYVKSSACFFRFIESILRAFRRIMLSTIIKPYFHYGKKNIFITFFYIIVLKHIKKSLRKNRKDFFLITNRIIFYSCRIIKNPAIH